MQGMNWRALLAKSLLRLALVILLIAALWHYFSGLDLSMVADVSAGGFAFLVILLPYGFVFLTRARMAIHSQERSRQPGQAVSHTDGDRCYLLLNPGGVAVAEPMRQSFFRSNAGSN